MESKFLGLIMELVGVINAINALGFCDSQKLRAFAHKGFTKMLVIWGLCTWLCIGRKYGGDLRSQGKIHSGSYVCTMSWCKVHYVAILLNHSYFILATGDRVAKEGWLHTSLLALECLQCGHGKLVRKFILAASRPCWANCDWIYCMVGILCCGFQICLRD